MGKGHPGIRQLKPSRRFPKGGWEVRYRDPENATRRRTFETKQEARDFQAAARTDIRRGDWLDPRLALTPFRDVAEAWYSSPENDWKPKTRLGHRHTLDKYLLPALGRRPIGKITTDVLRSFLGDLPDHLSTTSKRAIFRTLTPIFSRAVGDGMLRVDPTRRVKLPSPERREMLFLSAEQVDALAREIGSPHDLVVLTAAYTGMRVGEIAALRVKSLDLLHGRVTVAEAISDVRGHLHFASTKNRKARSFDIPRFLVEALAAHLSQQEHGPQDLVFRGARGGPFRHNNWYRVHFKPAVRRLVDDGRWPDKELRKLRFHDLRHTAAALLIAQGAHPKAISDRLGHSSIKVTFDVYGHLLPDVEKTLVDGLETTYQGAVARRGVREDDSVVALGSARP